MCEVAWQNNRDDFSYEWTLKEDEAYIIIAFTVRVMTLGEHGIIGLTTQRGMNECHIGVGTNRVKEWWIQRNGVRTNRLAKLMRACTIGEAQSYRYALRNEVTMIC